MLKRVLTSLALAVLCVTTLNAREAHAFGFKQRYGAPTEAPGSGDGEFSSPFGMAEDIAGFTYMSDVGNHRIQKFAPDGTFVAWAGRCTGGGNCDVVNQRSMGFSCTAATCSGGGPGANPGQFNRPHGIAIKFGKLYVADRENHRIQVLDLVTGILEFPPFGGPAPGDDDGQFEAPYDVAVDSTGKIYVADSGNDRIQVLVPIRITLRL